MPVIKYINKNNELVDKYVIPLYPANQETNEDSLTIVKYHRKDYATTLNELHNLQKEFAKEKRYDLAKEIKESIKHFTQSEKAATIVINYYEKSKGLYDIDFPCELSDFMDYEFNSIYF